MIYAVIESGGKQYKAIEGEYIEVDLLPEEIGYKKTFDKVLLVANGAETLIGSPYLNDVSIDATITEHFKGSKIVVFKYRPKERYRVKTGHRQKYTRLMIDSIQFPGKINEEKTAEVADTQSKKARSKPSATSKKASPKPTSKPKTASAKPVKKPVEKSSATKKTAAKSVEKKTETTKKVIKKSASSKTE